MSNITKFDLLPNEIVVKFFEYFNAPDLFYSFWQLNNRYNTLIINNGLLHLDFQHIHKTAFDRFCQLLLLYPKIKKQIVWLRLSNEFDTCCQIQTFLSYFLLSEFSHLQSLCLIEIKDNEIVKINSSLSSLSNLKCFSLISKLDTSYEIIASLPWLNLVHLTIPNFYADLISFQKNMSSLTHLTVLSCNTLNNLYKLLNFTSNLKYLNVEISSSNDDIMNNNNLNLNDIPITCLTTIILTMHSMVFDHLEIFLKRIPHLKNLTISSTVNKQSVDASRWEHLISSSLQYLKSFKFQFHVILENQIEENSEIFELLEKFEQFQTDFWLKKHHWYSAYELAKDFAIIYSVPYLSHTYQLTQYTNRYCDALKKHKSCFSNVTDLQLFPGTLRKGFQHYFSNVKFLKLHCAYYSDGIFDFGLNKNQDINSLRMLINLSNLTHLDISSTSRMEASILLLKILKEATQISSLKIDASALFALMNNEELCTCFNKMIKTLYVTKNNDHLNISARMIETLGKTFSNIEQLRFPIQRPDDLFTFLNELANLTNLTVHCLFFPFDANKWFESNAKKLSKTFLFERVQNEFDVLYPTIHIWIGEMTH